jgi:hypothetical protein
MRLGSTVLAVVLILFGLLAIYSLSISDLLSKVNSFVYNDHERPEIHYYADRTSATQEPLDNTLVEIVKSFKSSSGFYGAVNLTINL